MFHGHIAPACSPEVPLVNGPSPVPDNQMTASSQNNADLAPRYARLHNTVVHGAWCPAIAETNAATPSMYIQVSTVNVTFMVISLMQVVYHNEVDTCVTVFTSERFMYMKMISLWLPGYRFTNISIT